MRTAATAAAGSAHDPDYRRYHDEEWGTPLHGDRELFEKVSPRRIPGRAVVDHDPASAGPAFRRAFHDFDPATVAG